ncbi:MAG TPA: metallophosphoesterase [Thermomicrobiales bacterium]
MRVLLIGDLHGEISAIGRIVATLERRFDFAPDLLVQVGDWGFFADMGEWSRVLRGEIALPQIPAYVVHGNHDGYAETMAAMAGIASLPQLHVFPPGGDCWIAEVGSEPIALLGLGGAYDAPTTTPSNGIPFSERDPAIALERWEAAGEPAIDLLITHEAPTGCGALGERRYRSPWRSGSPGIRQLWERVNPPLVVCGHYHQELTHIEGSRTLRVLSLAGEGAAIYDTATHRITAFSPHPAP